MASSSDPQARPSSANPPPSTTRPPPPPLPPSQPPSSSSSPAPRPVYMSQSHHQPVVAAKTHPNPNPHPSQLPKIFDPSAAAPSRPQGIPYPVSSSGRGFIPKNLRPPQSTDQLVTVANPGVGVGGGGGGYPPRSVLPFPNHVQPYGFSPQDQQVHHQVHMMRPPAALHPSNLGSRPMGGGGGASGMPSKGFPTGAHPKVSPYPSASPDLNGYKDLRDRSRDDAVVTINDRKVRLSDGTSLYALCRSWVRNGLPQENQPEVGEGIKLLPRPLPITSLDTHTPKRNERIDEDEEKEEVGSVEHLSHRDLLQRHIKRAKRVRARLREERLQRIQRYKQRLSLLLPPPVEALKNDTSTGG